MSLPSILFFEEASTSYFGVGDRLDRAGFKTVRVRYIAELFSLFTKSPPDLVVLCTSVIEPQRALELAVQVRQVLVTVPLILFVTESSEELAIAALRAGFNEYIKLPLTQEELAERLRRCLTRGLPIECNKVPFEVTDRLVGDSAVMQEVRARLFKAAASDCNVLVTGETGTGKELAAELLHRNSLRRTKPFVTINCAAVPDSLFESELFGYERGAFTGADHSQKGKLNAASGGTVFLDEIGDMSLLGQAKMLRMIECHEIQPLGKHSPNPVNVRVIAATNRELEQLTREGSFRRDLFFRLAVTCIHLPPLRERKQDLYTLLAYYIGFYNNRFDRSVQVLSNEAMELILAYDWPGNVRELKNLVEAIFVDLPSPDTEVAELPSQFRNRCTALQSASGDERARLVWALSATNWNKSKAALRLHWSRMTLYRKLARYNIQQHPELVPKNETPG